MAAMFIQTESHRQSSSAHLRIKVEVQYQYRFVASFLASAHEIPRVCKRCQGPNHHPTPRAGW